MKYYYRVICISEKNDGKVFYEDLTVKTSQWLEEEKDKEVLRNYLQNVDNNKSVVINHVVCVGYDMEANMELKLKRESVELMHKPDGRIYAD
jgi:hypothetical protein